MAAAQDPQRIQIGRTYGRHQAVGVVVLKRSVKTDGGVSTHENLAGARAWVVLGEQGMAESDWEGAVECARAGLKELGPLYGVAARLRLGDDSDLTLGAAEDNVKKGKVQPAARVMLETLKWRTQLYARYHTDEIAE
jgi:hypothetical protein